jgi:tagatose-1,6-bisphosphate aldolase non-catalytic subunit AgaZ/GatZ
MTWVKKSFEDAIDAGYDLIHVDPTVDIELPEGEIISIETVADRTVELISHCESYRRAHSFPPVSYEVGTEEVHGGLADLNVFRQFFDLLRIGLKQTGYADVWPCFVVGKVGTDLHTTLFDQETARNIVKIAGSYGCLIKGHYSDNVQNPEAYPATGIGAANVGPEFTEREYDALVELDQLEHQMEKQGRIDQPSGMKDALWKAVVDSGRWTKWISEGEDPEDFYSIHPERQLWLVKTGCRYIWENPQVINARKSLYKNLEKEGINGEEVVLAHIENAMDRYYNSFNLVDLNILLNNSEQQQI